MKLFKYFGAFGLLLGVALAGAATAGQKEMAAGKQDIVDTAVSAGSFKSGVTALTAADLVETLEGGGPFSVFAPPDAAFAKIPQDRLEDLLADEPKLTAVLTYHVVPGRLMAADVAGLSSAKTVEGQSLTLDTTDGVQVNGARVFQADIVTSNGVIHVIDTVVMPAH